MLHRIRSTNLDLSFNSERKETEQAGGAENHETSVTCRPHHLAPRVVS